MADTAVNLNRVSVMPNIGEDTPGVELNNLYPALVECFGIILLGFLAARFNFISDIEAKGINTFVGTFALPALIFGSLCNLDMSTVRWTFVLAIFLSKALVFLTVLLISLIIIRPLDPAKAGLFAIFSTQSNDFALGYPILKAIYDKTHPEYPMYLYLLAPISLVVLNPIGFICMEMGRKGLSASEEHVSAKRKVFNLVTNVMRNPVVFMTVAGVAGNFVFRQSLPTVLGQFLGTLGSAFSASALFLLGVRMVGKNSQHLRGSGLIIALVLILVKTIALPIVSREVMSSLHPGDSRNETENLSNFAFLYGTFPTAPSVFVFATQYDVLPELTAGAMVACTFVAAPIMFVSARLLSVTDINPGDYINELDNFLLDISIVGLLATIWVSFVFVMTQRYQRMPHSMTFALVVAQSLACVGAILWSLIDCTHGWKLYLQFVFFAYGVYATRITTALLAVTVFLTQVKPAAYVLRVRRVFLSIGFGVPVILVLALIFSVGSETARHGQKIDPNFQYGETQAAVALVVLVLSFCVTVAFLVLTQRYQMRHEMHSRVVAPPAASFNVGDGSSRHLLESTTDTEEDNAFSYNTMGVAQSPRPLVAIEDLIEEVETVIEDDDACHQGQNGRQGEVNRACNMTRDEAKGGAQRRTRYRCDTEHREYCSTLLTSYVAPPGMEAMTHQEEEQGCMTRPTDEIQVFRHSVYLLLLSTSMFIGIALCIWTLVKDEISGLYLELLFLDGFLNFGQGLFALALFGLDVDYITVPIRRWFRRMFYGADSLVLPHWEDLGADTKLHCRQFLKHHIEKCMETIVKDVRCRLVTHRAAFRGSEMVDWLLEVGLARDRAEAAVYGGHLVKGRVIRHVDDYLDFYDDAFVYTFVPRNR